MKTPLDIKLEAARDAAPSLYLTPDVTYRGRVYCSPVRATRTVDVHWISFPPGQAEKAVTYVEKIALLE